MNELLYFRVHFYFKELEFFNFIELFALNEDHLDKFLNFKLCFHENIKCLFCNRPFKSLSNILIS